jgi:glycyl-tRNA synthetase beta chain
MGGIYARVAGEAEDIATAISEHYQPRKAEDNIPASLLGRILALADKTDTISSCFAIGLSTTDVDDAFELSCEARGVLRILIEGDMPLPLSQLVAHALRTLTVELSLSREQVQSTLLTYFQQCFAEYLTVQQIPKSMQCAVLDSYADVPADGWRVAQLQMREVASPRFSDMIRVVTRLANVTRHFVEEEMQPALFGEHAEVVLYQQYQQIAPQVEKLVRAHSFEELAELLATLTPYVDHFLTDILIMADDLALRQTRISLARRILTLYNYLGNLTALAEK